jgi:hypothetical protein
MFIKPFDNCMKCLIHPYLREKTINMMLLLVPLQLCGNAIQSCLQLFVQLFESERLLIVSIISSFLLKRDLNAYPFYLLNGSLFDSLCVQFSKDIMSIFIDSE